MFFAKVEAENLDFFSFCKIIKYDIIYFSNIYNNFLRNKDSENLIKFLFDNLEDIYHRFSCSLNIDLRNMPNGTYCPELIELAIRKDSKNKEYTNIWRNRIVKN